MNSATVTAPGRFAQLTEGIPRSFWALLAGIFVTKAGSFVLPLLFVYLSEVRNLPLETAGAVASLYGAGSLLGSLLGGAAADRFGRRITMLVALVTGAAFLLILGTATELWQLAAATFLTALTSDGFRPASQALAADVVPPQHRMKAFTIQYWAINFGFAVASVIGGYMAKRNFTALFIGDAVTTLVLAAIVWAMVPESRPAPEKAIDSPGNLMTPFLDKRFAPFLVLNFLTALLFFQHLTSLPNDMTAKGLSTEQFGWAVATNGVLIVLLQPFAARVSKKLTTGPLLAISAVLTGLGFGLNVFAHSLPQFALFVAVWTLGEILMAPMNATVVATLAPAHSRGRYQGAFNLAWAVAMMVAPLFGAVLIPRIGNDGVWLTCFGIGLAVALAHLTWSARTLPKVTATE